MINTKSYHIVNTTPFIVPFDQNARFVGRESQLAELEGKLFAGAHARKIAITGQGGIGKTQLALELAFRVRRKHKNCSVFWIPANDIESLDQAYSYIAQRLKIPDWDDKKSNVKKLVRLHLSMESTGEWLLLFDNVDEASLATAGSFVEYLPSSKHGAIVFTTADKVTAVTIASQNIVELPNMEEYIAQRMLDRCLDNPIPKHEEQVANLLLKELGYLPLAIVQAAAYVNINKIKLKRYLSLLAAQKKRGVSPLGEEHENPIAPTWLISFEQIRSRHKLAADYLLFMACIDRKDIPLALLPTASPLQKGLNPVGILEAYSFITKRPAESAVDLHRLVHLATRNWL